MYAGARKGEDDKMEERVGPMDPWRGGESASRRCLVSQSDAMLQGLS